VPNKRPVPRITIERLIAWNACYELSEMAAVFGTRKTLTPLQICDLDIPAHDRLWVVLRPAIIPDAELHELGFQFARASLPPASVRTAAARACRLHARRALHAKRQWLRGRISVDALRGARERLWRQYAALSVANSVSAAASEDARTAAYGAAKYARIRAYDAAYRSAPLVEARHVQAKLAEKQLARVRKVLARLYLEPKAKQV
jgi:hypothetical protein